MYRGGPALIEKVRFRTQKVLSEKIAQVFKFSNQSLRDNKNGADEIALVQPTESDFATVGSKPCRFQLAALQRSPTPTRGTLCERVLSQIPIPAAHLITVHARSPNSPRRNNV